MMAAIVMISFTLLLDITGKIKTIPLDGVVQ